MVQYTNRLFALSNTCVFQKKKKVTDRPLCRIAMNLEDPARQLFHVDRAKGTGLPLSRILPLGTGRIS